MSYSRFNARIDIVQARTVKNAAGFGRDHDEVLAHAVWACREEKRGNEFWAAKAAVFARANVLFRLRRIPGLEVTTKMTIVADGVRHNILHVGPPERSLYIDVLTERIEPSRG